MNQTYIIMNSELIIKELCTNKGITMKDLAEKVGLSANMLSMAISGRAGLSLKSLRSIADVLGVTIGELFADSRKGETKVYCPHCGKELTIEVR